MNAPADINVTTLKVVKVGNSAAVILPRHILAQLRVEVGDDVYLSESPGGAVRLTANNPEFAKQMAAAEAVMRKDREVLRVLAQ